MLVCLAVGGGGGKARLPDNGRLAGLSVAQSAGQSVGRSPGHSVGQSVSLCVGRTGCWSFGWSLS